MPEMPTNECQERRKCLLTAQARCCPHFRAGRHSSFQSSSWTSIAYPRKCASGIRWHSWHSLAFLALVGISGIRWHLWHSLAFLAFVGTSGIHWHFWHSLVLLAFVGISGIGWHFWHSLAFLALAIGALLRTPCGNPFGCGPADSRIIGLCRTSRSYPR